VNRRDFFERHAAKWDRERAGDLDGRLARVVAVAALSPGQRVLDVGSGTGVLIPHLRRAVGPDGFVVAIDFALGMLSQAKAKGLGARALLAQASVADLPFAAGDFDAVTCNAAFPHFPDRRRALAEMARVLRPGGRLAISHPIGRAAVEAIHRSAGGPVEHDALPDADGMRALLAEAGLRLADLIDEPEFFVALADKPRS
jgi:ubiquinone/menaquinone biosynthesis C-methylase UbiE